MNDRGMIKWMPFNSVVPCNVIKNEMAKKKSINIMPSLSEDQINDICDKITYAYHNKCLIDITYFYNGNIFNKKGKIKIINIDKHKLLLDDNKYIYFSQIIKIK